MLVVQLCFCSASVLLLLLWTIISRVQCGGLETVSYHHIHICTSDEEAVGSPRLLITHIYIYVYMCVCIEAC